MVALVGLLADAVVGCSPSVSDYLADKRFDAERKLAKVDGVREILAKTPPIESEGITDPGAPVRICDLLYQPFGPAPCNSWVIGAEQLADATRFRDRHELSFGDASWLVVATTLLANGRNPPTSVTPNGEEPAGIGMRIEAVFRWLSDIRFLFVVRTRESVKPTLQNGGKAYKAGHFKGEVLLFDLAEPGYLGGALFEHQMSGTASVKVDKGADSSPDLDLLFAKGVRQAVVNRIAAYMPLTEGPEGKAGR